jgi:hypothetical protein
VTKWGSLVVDRKLGTEYFSVENKDRWILSDDDRFEYEVKETKK